MTTDWVSEVDIVDALSDQFDDLTVEMFNAESIFVAEVTVGAR